MTIARLAAILTVSLAAATSSAVAAGETITLESDKTTMISVAVSPGTVVVGNPSIADISINGKQIFVHGRGYGNTNIIILDSQGAMLANFDVTVRQSLNNAVSLYRGSTRYSLACSDICEDTLQPGDSIDHFKNIAEQQSTKNDLATGSETTEAAAPQAPQ
jgi:ketopantoate hydroxymethyltransferase